MRGALIGAACCAGVLVGLGAIVPGLILGLIVAVLYRANDHDRKQRR